MIALLVAGCAQLNDRPSLASSVVAQPTRGYVYGRFRLARGSVTHGAHLFLQLTRMGTGEATLIQFHEASPDVYLIDVAPGQYELTELVYAPSLAMAPDVKASNLRVPARMSFMAQPFNVEAGKAYYVGDWTGVVKRDVAFYLVVSKVTIRWGLSRLVYDYAGATAAMTHRYPMLDHIEPRGAWWP